MNTALVLGALGIIGRNVAQYLAGTGRWRVKAVSRRRPDFATAIDFQSLDLLDPKALAACAAWLSDVTHVFFAAFSYRADPIESSRVNVALLRNIVEAVERAAAGFRHVGFCQGGNAYGAHLGRFKTPAQETDPRHFGPDFYYDQEDYLRAASNGKRWSWTALRPDLVFGFAVGNPMNIGNVLAVYASLCREVGVPLRFPGSPRAYEALAQITDATLLAKAMEWAALSERCYGEVFNITNGDVFRWSQMFSVIAEARGLDLAEPQPLRLVDAMKSYEPVWQRIVERNGLRNHRLDELANWTFGDIILNVEHDAFFDVGKARRFGFGEMSLDSGQKAARFMRQLVEEKVIPAV